MPRTSHPSLALLGVAVLAAGCSRENFRARADKDVEGVISQKNLFPEFQVQNWYTYPHPDARFAEPPGHDPDYPMYPPDDYAAWLTAPNPQHPGRGGAGRFEGKGYLHRIAAWDAQNRAEDEAEAAREREREPGTPEKDKDPTGGQPPGVEPDSPVPGEGLEFAGVIGGPAGYLRALLVHAKPFKLRLEQAVELAIFNSREFQDRREDLYLVALPVTLERYSFAAQALVVEEIIRSSLGRDVDNGLNGWRADTDIAITRQFATGASLLVRLANQIVVDLSGNGPYTSISTLGLTFIQPLLRGGGYAVTLEALTQAERTLLYAIRSYARFRKLFYVAIVGQGNYTNNPYGLQGLSANLGRGVGANLTASPTGYLPTILRAATLTNERKNVTALENFLRLFMNLREGGGVTELQVTRVEQNLIRSKNSVLTSTRQYLDNIDNFKLQLGIPATMPIELDDTPLRPIRQQLQRFDQVYDQLAEFELAAGRFDPTEPPTAVRERWLRLLRDSSLARGTRFAQEYPQRAEELRRLPDEILAKRIADLLARRQKLLDARAARQVQGKPDTPADLQELAAVEAAIDLHRFEQALRRYETGPWLKALPERRLAEQALAYRTVAELGLLVAIQARNQRLDRIRESWPPLPPICVDGVDLLKVPLDDAYGKVAQAALVNRLDLMNARAQVVDSWRQITVFANALRGVFDVQYDLNTATAPDGQSFLGFAGTRTAHTVTLRVEPPFVRRAERNAYRASLISFQRSRRNLMAFEDNIITDSRINLRQLRQLAVTYALQQRAIELAYSLVDNARMTFTAPPDPTSVRGAAGEAAALTQQLLDAQSSLLQAQNDLFTTWVTYQTVRMDLFLDLELLPLDARGIWTDDPPPSPDDRPDGPVGPDQGPAPQPAVGAERPPVPAPGK